MFKKIPVGEIFKLNNYIEMEEQKTISNSIVSRDDVEMELFSLGRGENISGNKIFKDNIYINLSGDLEIKVEDDKYMVGENCGVLVKKDSVVEVETIQGSKILRVNFNSKIKTKEDIMTLSSLLEVIKSQVANITLGNNEILNIALISLDKGEKLSTHAAGGDAFVYVLQGETEIMIEGKEFNLAVGDSIIMPKNIPHSVYGSKPYIMLLIVLK